MALAICSEKVDCGILWWEGENMAEYRSGSHTVYDIKYHFIWITKYRYKILRGRIAERAREILMQGCEVNGLVILKGSVGTDHVHMLLSCPTDMSPSKIMQLLKGISIPCSIRSDCNRSI